MLAMEQAVNGNNYRWVEQDCPICEVPPTRKIGRRGGRAHREGLGVECDVWRCGRCGLIFPHPMPVPAGGLEQHYGVLPDDYFQNHDVDTKGASAADMLAHAEKLTGGRGRLLDIGAGRGDLLREAVQAGWTVTGIEPSSSFAEHAARYSGAEIKHEPVERCGFDDGSFDVVILAAVLEHLYNPNETVREIARILRTGGALFVDVPNEEGLYFRVGNLYQKLRRRDWVVNTAPTFSPFHLFGFGPRSLRALLNKHGLEPRDWRVYGGRAMVPSHGGVVGAAEQLAAHAVTALSNMGSLGTYIETWAIKSK
ncbi:MAG TPA: class I SAM-dependent methyltransferase [Pyrinomonadaceae bacterium]|jgi:SAM-dependent methyltransferase